MKNIKLLKDLKDYEKEITKDNIINIIGTKGSGKTTTSKDYLDKEEYLVINCDYLLELPTNEKENKELITIRDYLKEKYQTINDNFNKCYNDIINYINEKNKIGIIEGNLLLDIDINSLKGKIIIKRTSIIKCYLRAVKRDYHNEYFMNEEKKIHKYLYKITRLIKISKRRKSIFKEAKLIDDIITKLDKSAK